MRKLKHLPILKECPKVNTNLNPFFHKSGQPTLLTKLVTSRKFKVYGTLSLLTIIWANDLFAAQLASIEGLGHKLDQISTFSTSKVATTGFTLAVVIGAVTAAFRGSIALAASIFAIGVITVYYIDWIKGAFVPAAG